MNERRLARLRNQIQQRLAEVLQREIADPKLGLVTITRVELDSEFTRCKAYWSVIASAGNEKHAQSNSAGVLDRARGFCQREMAKVLHTRSVPHLEFHFDAGIGGAARMNELLKELRDQRGPETDKVDEQGDDTATSEAPPEATSAPDSQSDGEAKPASDGEPRNDD